MLDGEYIYRLIEENRLNLKDIAKEMGVSVHRLATWLNGSAVPNQRQKAKLAEILGIRVVMLDQEKPTRADDTECIKGRVMEWARRLGASKKDIERLSKAKDDLELALIMYDILIMRLEYFQLFQAELDRAIGKIREQMLEKEGDAWQPPKNLPTNLKTFTTT